jgi:hypothetical protein
LVRFSERLGRARSETSPLLKIVAAAANLALAAGIFAAPVAGLTLDGTVTLELPRSPTISEAIYLRLGIGVLPPHATLVVKTRDGQILGTVAPYGRRPNQKVGIQIIPVPAHSVVNGTVSLRLEVEPQEAAVRPPKENEVENARLVIQSVTRTRDEH